MLSDVKWMIRGWRRVKIDEDMRVHAYRDELLIGSIPWV